MVPILNTNHIGSGAHLANCLIWKGKCEQINSRSIALSQGGIRVLSPSAAHARCSNYVKNQKGTSLLPMSKGCLL